MAEFSTHSWLGENASADSVEGVTVPRESVEAVDGLAIVIPGNDEALELHLASRPDLIERLETGLDQLARGEGTERAW